MRTIMVALCASALLSGCFGGGGGGRGDKVPGDPCTETQECIPGSICFNEFCIGEGNLRVSLSFFDDTDLDLHLITPNGSEIYFANSMADGATLDVDQCVSSCGAGGHVENIVFEVAPPTGNYETFVINYDGRAAATFDIEIAGDGIDTNFQGSVGAVSGQESEHLFFDI